MSNNKNGSLFENEHYYVLPSSVQEYYDENGNVYEYTYVVVNKSTQHVELITPQLASALFAAAEFNHVIEKRPYLWRESASEKDGLEDLLARATEEDAPSSH